MRWRIEHRPKPLRGCHPGPKRLHAPSRAGRPHSRPDAFQPRFSELLSCSVICDGFSGLASTSVARGTAGAHVGFVCLPRYATGTSGKIISPRRSRRARRRKRRGERTALQLSHTPFVAFKGEWVVVCLGLWRRQGYLRKAFHGHDPPFVVFVLFVVNTNRRPMPPSRGRSLY